MTITTWNRTNTSRYDEGFKDSVQTPNYHKIISEGKLLPINYYRFWTLLGSAPRSNLPSSVGGANYGYFSGVPRTSVDMYDILSAPNGELYNREVMITNNRNPPNTTSTAKWNGFPTIYHQELRVTNKLVKKLNSRDIDLGVALGEARETAAFIQSACLRLYAAYHAARKGDPSGVIKSLGLTKHKKPDKQRLRDVPDAAAGVWLEYSYAVRPLLADVYGAVSALEKRHRRPEVVHARARVSSELDHAMATSGVHMNGADIEWSCKGHLSASAELSFEIANPFMYTLSQLGLTNPLNVAWELVPFSFVADWFIPIGAWFDGMVPPQGISNVKGSITHAGEFRGKGRYICNFPVPPNTADGTRIFPGSWYSKFKGRKAITNYPRFHLVGATFDLSKEQIASGVSLLWAVGSGRKTEKNAYERAARSQSVGGISGGISWKGTPKFPTSYEHL